MESLSKQDTLRSQFRRAGIPALLAAVFIDLVCFGMAIPDVQTRLEGFGAKGWQIGLVLSSYFLVQIAVSPFWGRLSDRIGRKPVLLTCGILSAVSMLAYASAHSAWLILASRILAGFAGASVTAAQAYVSDATVGEDDATRTAALGKVSATMTAGLMLGPAAGGWLAGMGGNRLLGFIAAAIAGLGVLWIAFTLPSARPTTEEPKSDTASKRIDVVAKLSLLKEAPDLRSLFVLASIIMLALACLEGTFGRLIARRLGLGPQEFGAIFAYEALVGILVQSVLLERLSRRASPRALLGTALVLQSIGLGLTPFTPSLLALFGASTLYGLGTGLAMPTLNGLTSAVTPMERQGEMFGLMQGARSLGFLVGPSIGGLLFDWNVEAPYLLASGVLLAATFAVRLVVKVPMTQRCEEMPR